MRHLQFNSRLLCLAVILVCVLAAVIGSHHAAIHRRQVAVDKLVECPSLYNPVFTAGPYVDAAAELRNLSKYDAIAALEDYAQIKPGPDNVLELIVPLAFEQRLDCPERATLFQVGLTNAAEYRVIDRSLVRIQRNKGWTLIPGDQIELARQWGRVRRISPTSGSTDQN